MKMSLCERRSLIFQRFAAKEHIRYEDRPYE